MKCIQFKLLLLWFSLGIAIISCTDGSKPPEDQNGKNGGSAIPTISYSVVNTYPHDTSFYTEGFEFQDGKLWESSGGKKEQTPHPSAFGIVDLKSGKVDRKIQLDNAVFFGEGITIFKDKIYQLTYHNQKGFIYDLKSYKKLREFDYQGEGWGLTHDSSKLIMSNGSSTLKFLDPETLRVLNLVTVVDHNGPVGNLNELEYVDGFVYANQWQTNYILKINPSDGKIVGRLDLSSLENEARNKLPDVQEMNGIAYNSATKTFYVTGKLWPTIYEIKF